MSDERSSLRELIEEAAGGARKKESGFLLGFLRMVAAVWLIVTPFYIRAQTEDVIETAIAKLRVELSDRYAAPILTLQAEVRAISARITELERQSRDQR